MLKNGCSANIANYCADNWRENTSQHYWYRLKAWIDYNNERGLDKYIFTGDKVKDLLVYLFEVKEKTITSIRATYIVCRFLSNAAGSPITLKDHKQITMMMNGMFSKRPGIAKPKTNHVWDISVLLDYFAKGKRNKDLSLKDLGAKLCCLILLATMRRRIDLSQLDIKNLSWSNNKSECIFHLPRPTKSCSIHTTNNRMEDLQNLKLVQIPFTQFSSPSDLKMCPVRCLKEYLKRTAALRINHTKLIIISCEPFTPTASATICRWVKDMMERAGIDITKFATHSVRSASSSKAFVIGISLSSIMRRAGWLCESVFIDHYLREIDSMPKSLPGVGWPVTPNWIKTVPPTLPPIHKQHSYKYGRHIKADISSAQRMKKFASLWNSSPVECGPRPVSPKESIGPSNLKKKKAKTSATVTFGDGEDLNTLGIPPPLLPAPEDELSYDSVLERDQTLIDPSGEEVPPPPEFGDGPTWDDVPEDFTCPAKDLLNAEGGMIPLSFAEHVPEPPEYSFVEKVPKKLALLSETSVPKKVSTHRVTINKKGKEVAVKVSPPLVDGDYADLFIDDHDEAPVTPPVTPVTDSVSDYNECSTNNIVEMDKSKQVMVVPNELVDKCYVNDKGEQVVEINLPDLDQVTIGNISNIGEASPFSLVSDLNKNAPEDPVITIDSKDSEVPLILSKGKEIVDREDGQDFDSMAKKLLEGTRVEIPHNQGSAENSRKPGLHLWRCKLCGKFYSRRSALLTHVNVHMGHKPFDCELCGKSFFYRTSLNKHRLLHEAKGLNLMHTLTQKATNLPTGFASEGYGAEWSHTK